jgi:hypothetical protein
MMAEYLIPIGVSGELFQNTPLRCDFSPGAREGDQRYFPLFFLYY